MAAASGPDPPEDGDSVSWQLYVFDVLRSVASVAVVGFLVFSVSGVWPPLVAITSGSMDPHVQKGDLVFVMESDRFAGEGHHETTGVVTNATGAQTGYERFQNPGDVVVFAPDGNEQVTPIIHRAMFWVEAGENWVAEADPDHLGAGRTCEDVATCPAPHPGFVTKGDANARYDQVLRHPGCDGTCDPVRSNWITGRAEVRIPWAGHVRLEIDDA